MDPSNHVRVLHDGGWISVQPIDDFEPLPVPGVPQSIIDQLLELVFAGKLPEELSVRIAGHCTQEAFDDGLDLRFGIVEVGTHAHQHRFSSVQPPVQFWVRNLDGSRVQDDWAVEAEVVGDKHRKVRLTDGGTDDVDGTGVSFVSSEPTWKTMLIAVLVERNDRR